MSHCLVRNFHSLSEYVRRRIQLLISARRNQNSLRPNARALRRHVLFVMGGCESIETVETFDSLLDKWVSHYIPDAPSKTTWICNIGEKILVMELESERFRSFDVLTRSWTDLSSPPRYNLGSSRSFSDQHVYVLGGKDHPAHCHRYDVLTDQWDEMAPMSQERDCPASVCHAGKLYCSGGVSFPDGGDLSSLEVLDLGGDRQWSFLPPMNVSRSCHSLVSCGQFLWAIGGLGDLKSLSAVERYDVELRQWNCMRPLPAPRVFFSASVFMGRIHVIGGVVGASESAPSVNRFNRKRKRWSYTPSRPSPQSISSVFVYNEEQDKWARVPSLEQPRGFHSSCVVFFSSDVTAELYAVSIQ